MLLALLFVLAFLALWLGLYLALPAAWSLATSLASSATRGLLRRQRFAVWYERGRMRLHPLHPYRPVAAIVAVGFLVAGLTGALFLGLAEGMQSQSPDLARIDQAVHQEAHRLRRPEATLLFLAFTLLGTAQGLGLVVLAAATLLALRRRPYLAAYLVATGLGGWGLNQALKVLYARARPDLTAALRGTSGYSFPSGHAMTSVAVFGGLVYVIVRVVPHWGARSASVALALALSLAISVSRVYLGVHWVSDIAAGLAAGTVWLAAVTGAYEVFRRLRRLR